MHGARGRGGVSVLAALPAGGRARVVAAGGEGARGLDVGGGGMARAAQRRLVAQGEAVRRGVGTAFLVVIRFV